MARYDKVRKIRRNQALLDYYRNNPDASLREIGTVFGISAQRVWEIIKNNDGNSKAANKSAA